MAVASFIIWVLTGHFPFASRIECNIITSQHPPFGLSAEGQRNHTPSRESVFVSFPGKPMTGNKGRNYKRWSSKIESSTWEFRPLFTRRWEQKAQCLAAPISREPSRSTGALTVTKSKPREWWCSKGGTSGPGWGQTTPPAALKHC